MTYKMSSNQATSKYWICHCMSDV